MKPLLSVIVTGLLLVNLVSGCASSAKTQYSESKDGSVTTIVAPVLWVGLSEDGSEASGVDTATVQINRASQEPFEIHLDGLAAAGAGPAWRASAGSAAVLGVLAGGLDPEITEIDFSVNSPIDGPSAGGILAVAVLAAAQRQPLLPNVAMTGSLTPDGTIGPVGGVARKLEAAHQAGFTEVVIPRMTGNFTVESGGAISAHDYAQSLGIRAIEVDTVSQAYQALTGKPLLTSASVLSLQRDASNTVISARVEKMRKLFEMEAVDVQNFPLELATLIEHSSREAEVARLLGHVDSEYASLFLPLASMRIHHARSRVENIYREFGPQKVAEVLNSEAQSLLDRVSFQLEAVKLNLNSTASTVGFEQLSVLNSLNWAATESAIIKVSETDSLGEMHLAAEQIAEAQLETDVAEMLMAHSFEEEIDSSMDCQMTEQGDSYAKIMWQAGSAAVDYLAAVQKFDVAENSGVGQDLLARGVDLLLDQGEPQNTPDCNVGASAVQLSSAINLFAMTTGLVGAGQSYDVEPPENAGLFSIGTSTASMSESVRQSVMAVSSVAHDLRSQGLSLDETTWSLAWVDAGNEIYNLTSIGSHVSWVSLNESWSQLVVLLVVRSAFIAPANAR